MMFSKLAAIGLFFAASQVCLGQDSCTADVTEVTTTGGHAMLQTSDTAPGGRKVPARSKAKAPVNAKSKTKKSKKAKSPDASNVALTNGGYGTIADTCCNYEMEEYVRRLVMSKNLKVCDEGGLQGIVPYHSCENKQNLTVLNKELGIAQTGSCAWLAPKAESCKKMSKSCGQAADPMSHRRRNCGRADNSQDLDLEMQNAATQEFQDSKCGTHQIYTDVKSETGLLKKCKIKGDLTENTTAIKVCLNECCDTTGCIGVGVTDAGTILQKSFADAVPEEGSISYLHRQR